jgi:uncharacterized protein (TIGR02001 family)
MKKLLLASAISGLFAVSTIASAQTAPAAPAAAPTPEHTFTGNIGLFSDYRFRGISQTFKQAAVQGGFDYSHSSGLYLGTWASNVTGTPSFGPGYQNGSLEWDMYGGYKGSIVEDLGFDVGLLYYYYPNARYVVPTKDKYNNTEIYGALTWKWLTAKYNYAISDYFGTNSNTFGGFCGVNSSGLQFVRTNAPNGCFGATPGGSRGSGYLDISAAYELAPKLNLLAHVGHLSVANYSQFNYNDYKLGLTYEYNGFVFGASYISTDAKAPFYRAVEGTGTGLDVRDTQKGTILLSVSKTL